MGGDYPSNGFDIEEDGGLRRIVHLPTGMIIEIKRMGDALCPTSTAAT